MLCVMMLPLVVVGLTSRQSVSQREATIARRDNAAWLADTSESRVTQREADHYAKQLEGTQKYINELV